VLKDQKFKDKRKCMNLIKSFFNWIMGWIVMGVIILVVGFGIKTFSGSSDNNTSRPTKETTVSKDEKLIEIRKEYWENGNLKSEVPYRKHYGLGWKKVKTTLIPHGIAKSYYENGVLKKEDPYVDGERTGTLKIYDEEGHIKADIEYRNNKQDGPETWYYSDGSVMDVTYYKDGNKTEGSVL
jgi:antitoxin component YwqK of YwqJK toxin-antitoxin module